MEVHRQGGQAAIQGTYWPARSIFTLPVFPILPSYEWVFNGCFPVSTLLLTGGVGRSLVLSLRVIRQEATQR